MDLEKIEKSTRQGIEKQKQELEAENARLKEALHLYADPHNWGFDNRGRILWRDSMGRDPIRCASDVLVELERKRDDEQRT